MNYTSPGNNTWVRWEKRQCIYMLSLLSHSNTWLLNDTLKGRRAWTDILQVLKDHSCQLRQTLLDLKSYINPSAVIVGDFVLINRQVIQEKKLENLWRQRHHKSNRPNRYLHKTQTPKNILSFSSPWNFCWTWPHKNVTDTKKWQEKSLNKYRKTEIASCLLSDYHGLRWDVTNNDKNPHNLLETTQHTTKWKLDQGKI